MVPLLLIDGTPQWLQEHLSSFTDSETLAERALVFSLVVLMYETGLYFEDSEPNLTETFNIKLMKKLPSSFSLVKDDGRYKFTFRLQSSLHRLHLAVTPMESILIVNLLIPEVKVISCALMISEYIDVGPQSQTSVKNNRKLSIIFKNHIDSMTALMVETAHSRHLLGLPVEILYFICEHLRPQDFVSFGKTCKQANSYLENDHIWKSLARLYLPSHKTPIEKSWKEFVVYQFKRERDFVHRPVPLIYETPFRFLGPII